MRLSGFLHFRIHFMTAAEPLSVEDSSIQSEQNPPTVMRGGLFSWVGSQMSDAPIFHRVAIGSDPLVDVIFVHGLTGDAQRTWTVDSSDAFWPPWLQEDLDRLAVYTLGYPTSLFEKWAKKEMDMFERASNVLELIAGNGIGVRPIVFVSHSLGGILTKLLLRKASEALDEDWKRISEATKLVVFLSTPHTGSALASVLNAVPFTSTQIRLLSNETGFLHELNEHYRNLATEREDLSTAVYYEKHLTKKLAVVVERSAADPGVVRTTPVAVDKDHINICKPRNREDIIYLGVKRHVQKVLTSAEQLATETDGYILQSDDYTERSGGDRRDLLEKLIEAGREHEYAYANDAQNHFARQYTRTGLFTAAREDHDNLLSEVETRFVNHVYHPLICRSASNSEIMNAIQESVIDPLVSKGVGGTQFNSKGILRALYFLTEQCYIRWDSPS